VPVFPPALTLEKCSLFVAAMCGNMVNAQKKVSGSEHRLELLLSLGSLLFVRFFYSRARAHARAIIF
jgi:hypothetical protein